MYIILAAKTRMSKKFRSVQTQHASASETENNGKKSGKPPLLKKACRKFLWSHFSTRHSTENQRFCVFDVSRLISCPLPAVRLELFPSRVDTKFSLHFSTQALNRDYVTRPEFRVRQRTVWVDLFGMYFAHFCSTSRLRIFKNIFKSQPFSATNLFDLSRALCKRNTSKSSKIMQSA